MGRDALNQVDWALPGMEDFSEEDIKFFKRAVTEDDGPIVNQLDSLGWAFWPVANKGFFDERILRKIADFLEIQNKPFWDDYDAYCKKQEGEWSKNNTTS